MPGFVGVLGKPLTVATGPIPMTGLRVWLDATNASTFTYTSGRVTQWQDVSGLANHAVSLYGATYAPARLDPAINGLAAVNFARNAGTETGLEISTWFTSQSKPVTAVIIVKLPPTLINDGALWG